MSTEKLLQDIISQALNDKNSLIAQWEEEKKNSNKNEQKELDSFKIKELQYKEESKKKITLRYDSLIPAEKNILLISKFGNFIEKFFIEYKDKVISYFKPFNDVKEKIQYIDKSEAFLLIIPEKDKKNEENIIENLKKNGIRINSVKHSKADYYVLENKEKTMELKDSPEIYFNQIKKILYNMLLGFIYDEYNKQDIKS